MATKMASDDQNPVVHCAFCGTHIRANQLISGACPDCRKWAKVAGPRYIVLERVVLCSGDNHE
jgi:hypothetical protein